MLNYIVKDGVREYTPSKTIYAQSYWLLEKTVSNEFDVEFFTIQGDQLVLIDTGDVIIDLPDTTTLDQRIYTPLKGRGVGVNY